MIKTKEYLDWIEEVKKKDLEYFPEYREIVDRAYAAFDEQEYQETLDIISEIPADIGDIWNTITKIAIHSDSMIKLRSVLKN